MQITVNVSDIDLSTVVTERGDPDYGYEEVTLATLVAEQIVQRIVGDMDVYPKLIERVKAIRDEEIRSRIAPLIEEAIARPVQQTDSYGSPKGEPVTLTSLIIEQAKKYLSEPTGDRYSNNGKTPVQKFIEDAVGSAFQRELTEAVTDAKAKAVATVRARASELLAGVIGEGLKR